LSILDEQGGAQTSETKVRRQDERGKSGAGVVALALWRAVSSGTSLVEVAFADVLGGRAEVRLVAVVGLAGVTEVGSWLQVEDTLDELELGSLNTVMMLALLWSERAETTYSVRLPLMSRAALTSSRAGNPLISSNWVLLAICRLAPTFCNLVKVMLLSFVFVLMVRSWAIVVRLGQETVSNVLS
jgi:hypothetical protein